MRHYPSYTFEMVLSEYTCRFFALIAAAIRFDALEKLEMITVISIPHMKEEDGERIISAYRKQFGQEMEFVDKEKVKIDRQRLLQKLKRKVL